MRLAAGPSPALPSDGQHEQSGANSHAYRERRHDHLSGMAKLWHPPTPAGAYPLILLLIGHTEILLTTCWRGRRSQRSQLVTRRPHRSNSGYLCPSCAPTSGHPGSPNASLRRAVAARIAARTRSGDRAQRDLSILIGRGFATDPVEHISGVVTARFQRLGPNAGGGAERGLGALWSCDLVRVFLLAGRRWGL